ncbi:hypothetical protein L3Y34_013159 [Caenorhabditis briggsae]|uniref:Uncharacterized protein n=1 Tax=Caenorhabditis briggsae TaxID=6238 RepID=A0AAE8ZXQ4_CAEBR|nr:hypothetical protein L3Y34_013159 [Caenorhabditis briggsae]
MGSKSSKRAETTVDSAESDASSEEANGLMTLSQEQVEGARGTLEEIMARMDVEKSLHGTASDRYKKMVKQKEILLEIIRLGQESCTIQKKFTVANHFASFRHLDVQTKIVSSSLETHV